MKLSTRKKPALSRTPELTFRTIMVPVDFSPISQEALSRAIAFAVERNASLVLFHVVEPIIHSLEFVIVPPEMDEINLRELEAAKKRILPLRAQARNAEVRSRVVVRLGKPWNAIVEAAREYKVDLIIMPTHGRTGLDHTFFGSTAERVVQHAPCSVLVLRSSASRIKPSSRVPAKKNRRLARA